MSTMNPSLSEYLSSVLDVWIVWFVGLLWLSWALRRGLRLEPWERWKTFAADERGASYALPYVLTFPAYLLLMCLMIQATLILMVKIGTVGAAHAAARTAMVWQPSKGERAKKGDDRLKTASERAQRAAALAMAPFSSGFDRHLQAVFPTSLFQVRPRIDAEAYYQMYRRLGQASASRGGAYLGILDRFDPGAIAPRDYVVTKVRYAFAATRVDIEGSGVVPWNEDLKVKVTHTMPMHVPAVGRAFGDWWKPYFARDIETTVTLPSEAAQSKNHVVTIPYDPAELVL